MESHLENVASAAQERTLKFHAFLNNPSVVPGHWWLVPYGAAHLWTSEECVMPSLHSAPHCPWWLLSFQMI